MIIFDLVCRQSHPFEAWFHSQAAYDSQLENGLIACPHCGSSEVRRIPSAPHLARTGSAPMETKELAPKVTPGALQTAYQHLMSAIVAHCEDVGADFADEARKIHYMEAPQRSIRGQASSEDYDELRDEGIDVLRVPLVKKH